MKLKIILILILTAIAGVFYFLPGELKAPTTKTEEGLSKRYATFSKSELGVQFDYRAGPDGYVLEETTPADTKAGLVRALTLFRTEDKLKEIPANSEGPPVIAIYIFNNLEKQWPQAWADEHIQYSNINLKIGEVRETSIGGAKAIRYMADGLYVSENAVIVHGENVYVVTGQFLDENSDIRRDLEPLLNSIRFIPKPGQE